MKVLIACEESQTVCKAFREKGHEAFSCDIQESSGGKPEWHLQMNCFKAIGIIRPNLMIAHPPCTYLSNAGIGYFNEERYGAKAVQRKAYRLDAFNFFMRLYAADVEKICIENPVGYVNSIIKPTQTINPSFFGDPHNKRTCLWLKNLPKLFHAKQSDLFAEKTHVGVEPIYIDKSGKKRYFADAISGSMKNTQKLRSKTFDGIANAMAEQWG